MMCTSSGNAMSSAQINLIEPTNKGTIFMNRETIMWNVPICSLICRTTWFTGPAQRRRIHRQARVRQLPCNR